MNHIGTITPARLNDEWDRLRHRRRALRSASDWGVATGPVHDLQQILDSTGPDQPDADRERVLHRLVTVARHDELAARILLQRLLPELVAIHRRRSRQPWTHPLGVGFGDLVATAWTIIRTYNPARRPARLVNSLVSDVEYREYRAPLRRIGHGTPSDPIHFDRIVDETSTDPMIELADLLADPATELDETERDLLRRLLNGTPSIEIARDLGVTTRTIRNRRRRIAVRLRSVSVAA